MSEAVRSNRKIVVSICGASGLGKSQLAKTLVAKLGDEESVRVPTDNYLVPAMEPLEAYAARPLRYDWALLEQVLALPEGTATTTPAFDFEAFRRVADIGGKPFIVRRIVVIDAMYPYPKADAKVLLAPPSDVRKARIVERDKVWGTTVIGRWDHLEVTRSDLEAMNVTYDLVLPGTERLEDAAESVLVWLKDRSVLRSCC